MRAANRARRARRTSPSVTADLDVDAGVTHVPVRLQGTFEAGSATGDPNFDLILLSVVE